MTDPSGAAAEAPPPPRPAGPPPAALPRWLSLAAWLLPVAAFAWQIQPVLRAAPPAPIAPPAGETRFGLAPTERRAIFDEIMRPVPGLRQRALRDFPNHAWTREDHYYNMLRGHIAAVGRAHGVTYTHAYLVFDDGVHARWPGPDGQPHPATTLPLVGARTPDP